MSEAVEQRQNIGKTFFAEAILDRDRPPFEFLGVMRPLGLIRAVVSVPTCGLDPLIQSGEVPYQPGDNYDQAVLRALEKATETQDHALSVSGTIIDFTTRERSVFLKTSTNTTWIGNGNTYEHAVTNALAALTLHQPNM